MNTSVVSKYLSISHNLFPLSSLLEAQACSVHGTTHWPSEMVPVTIRFQAGTRHSANRRSFKAIFILKWPGPASCCPCEGPVAMVSQGSFGFVPSAASISLFDGNHITCRGRIPQLLVFFAPWLLPTWKISACAASIEAKCILIQLLCAAPAADFPQLDPDTTLYIAKQFLSQQPILTRTTGGRHSRQKHDAIKNQCQQLHLYQAGMTATKYGKTWFSQHFWQRNNVTGKSWSCEEHTQMWLSSQFSTGCSSLV